MKKFACIMSLLACMFCTTQAKERIIERPPFIAWSSPSIEVDKIVTNDTVTTVYIKAFYRPKNWIKIAAGSFLKDNNGKLYPLRGGVGITPDKEFWMPESGEAEFQLLFPPLPENVASVDFSEGDFDDAFKIWGIQLMKKDFNKFKLPKNITEAKVDPKITLPEPTSRSAKATLKGSILDYRKGMPDKGTLYFHDIIRGAYQREEIQINEDGTFQKELDAFTVTPCTVRLPFGQASCLLAPGETTSLIINSREGARQQSHLRQAEKPYGKAVYYNGYLAGLQQEMADYKLPFGLYGESYDDYKEEMKVIDGKTPEEYKAYILTRLSELKQQITQSKCSPAYKEIANISLDLATAQTLLETESQLKHAHITAHNLERENARKYYNETKIEIPQEYYECLNNFSYLTSPKACYSPMYIEFLETISNRTGTAKVIKGLQDKGSYLSLNAKARAIGASIKDFSPLTDTQKAEIAEMPVAYNTVLSALNDDLMKKIEINKKKTGFTINEAGQVSNEDLFPSIISKFRGHTLLVDFWATWCGPCRTANKEMIPMKEELKDKDIIYIYLTGETSPLGTWNNMIPDIHGEHYRVTKDQWSYLMSTFNIQGVPTYFIIDRKGNITYKQTGFPGTEMMKKKLLEALDK